MKKQISLRNWFRKTSIRFFCPVLQIRSKQLLSSTFQNGRIAGWIMGRNNERWRLEVEIGETSLGLNMSVNDKTDTTNWGKIFLLALRSVSGQPYVAHTRKETVKIVHIRILSMPHKKKASFSLRSDFEILSFHFKSSLIFISKSQHKKICVKQNLFFLQSERHLTCH